MVRIDHVVKADGRKTKEELIAELETLRQHLRELERTEGSARKESTDALEKELKQIFKDIPIGVCYFDRNLRYLLINGWLAAINGIPADDHLGRTIGEVLPDVAARVESQLRSVIETGEPIIGGTVDAPTPAHPGQIRSFQHNYFPVESGDGTVVGVSCVVEDITERKRAEEALHEARDNLEARVEERTRELGKAKRKLESEIAERIRLAEQYEALLEAAPDPTISVDQEGKIVLVNMQAERVFGYGRDELIGQDLEILVPNYLRDRHIQHRREYLRDPVPRAMGTYLELAVVCKDGHELPVEISLNPVQASEKGVVISSIRDITQRREMAKALQESREHFRRLLESTNAIPWEADVKTWMFTYVGPQAVKLLGYPREQWLEEDFWVGHIHPEDREWTIDYCLKSTAQRENYEFEYRMIAADGRIVWIDDIVNVMKQDGEPVVLRGFMIDITERKRLEEIRRDLSARLINAQEEERRRIARDIHDDFSQRLALFAVQLQQLSPRISEIEPKAAEQLDNLRSRSQELATDLHRLSHRLHPSILLLGLVPAVRSLCSEFTEHHGVQVAFTELEIPTSISHEIALCLYRVVQVSLQNVVKHSGAKEAKVELTASQDAIHLRVSDRGVGFKPADVGTKGLGLVSIQERLSLLRGQFSIRSRPSRGTRIDVNIPLVAPDA